ncbi:MAG: type II toxin-antitoxin system HicA family toxin [Ignavibacteria bacterium]|nr:type II toxin-antitoxin system HicA family toxin [Ignavibacteria bacterium]
MKHLKINNCVLLREGAKHSVFINLTNNKQTTIPRHPDIYDMLCKEICKQLDIKFIK